ncbi:unnamed protein product [Dibothriocephalus latus]|uniref:Uncharacterized protein n=1 Tax=Dibothriocephalus latus TaxID=60516 RepID=A0A3P7MDD5_DIBLA|nr:unnamed protein product [Dibothriocephalus latus]
MTPSTPTLTQGDQLNRIKLIRKRAKNRHAAGDFREDGEDGQGMLANSYPRSRVVGGHPDNEDEVVQAYDLAVLSNDSADDCRVLQPRESLATSMSKISLTPYHSRSREFGNHQTFSNVPLG